MIIKARPFPAWVLRITASIVVWVLRFRLNKIKVHPINIKKGHSYLLMCNHFSFWDGFWAAYLCSEVIRDKRGLEGLYIMIMKKQLQMNPWLTRFGCFSVNPGKVNVHESLSHAAELLNVPGNIVLMYPQGNLESQHIRKIEVKEGIETIVTQVKGDCQLIWSSNIVEYFESIKPSVSAYMLDCGTNHDFDFERLKREINEHHQKALDDQVRHI